MLIYLVKTFLVANIFKTSSAKNYFHVMLMNQISNPKSVHHQIIGHFLVACCREVSFLCNSDTYRFQLLGGQNRHGITWMMQHTRSPNMKILQHLSKVYSESCQTSKMEPFAKKFTAAADRYFHKKLHLRCLAGV